MARAAQRLRTLPAMAAAGLLAAVGLVACDGGGEEPTPTGSSSETESPSAEQTPTPEIDPPVPPNAIVREDVHGAEAAAEYFLELYGYAYATGDLAEWNEFSEPDCEFCRSVSDDVRALYAAGGYITGREVVVEEIGAAAPVEGFDYFRVDAVAREGEAQEFRSENSSPTPVAAARQNLKLALRHTDEGWLVGEVEVVSTEGVEDAG